MSDLSPGAERAVMRIAELLPKLMKSMEKLCSPQVVLRDSPPRDDDTVSLTISMTADEWSEVINAVDIRATQIRNEIPDDDMNKEQLESWANQLDAACRKMALEAGKHQIVY